MFIAVLRVAMLVAFAAPCFAQQPTFTFPPPATPARLQTLQLWSTQYYIHAADAVPVTGSAVELRRRDGTGTGLGLPRADWCGAAMEGTVAVRTGGVTRVFNADGLGDEQQVDCSFLFRRTEPAVLKRLGRQVFAEVSGARIFGLGVSGYRLVPFRTVATDPSAVPTGTVLYIEGLRGKMVHLPDGSTVPHDGYVFAADRGGSILGNHIDFFTGTDHSNPAPKVVTSSKARGFPAQVVTDAEVVASLKALHLVR